MRKLTTPLKIFALYFLFNSVTLARQGDRAITVSLDETPIVSSVTKLSLKIVRERDIPMIPVRFIEENLRVPVEYDLLWNIFSIEGLHFKVGEAEMHLYEPKTGGNLIERFSLPSAPKIINGRLYVPMEVVLNAIGHKVSRVSSDSFSISTTRSTSILPSNVPRTR